MQAHGHIAAFPNSKSIDVFQGRRPWGYMFGKSQIWMISTKNGRWTCWRYISYWKWGYSITILLMVQKSGVHQLRLVVYPIIYEVLYIPGGKGINQNEAAIFGEWDSAKTKLKPSDFCGNSLCDKIPGIFTLQKQTIIWFFSSHWRRLMGDSFPYFSPPELGIGRNYELQGFKAPSEAGHHKHPKKIFSKRFHVEFMAGPTYPPPQEIRL